MNMIDLAQRGIGQGASLARLTYSQGDLEIYSPDAIKKIESEHLDAMITEAGDPHELNNLDVNISQDNPVRRVHITIGPGNWTTYTIESDDNTWAFGRYHELTELLLKDRSAVAKASRRRGPEILRDATDNTWRRAPWEPIRDTRANFVFTVDSLLYLACAMEVIWLLDVFNPGSPGKTQPEKQAYVFSVNEAHWIVAHMPTMIFLNLAYIVGCIAWIRWQRFLSKSKVILDKSRILSQFSPRSKAADAVALGSFYLTLLMLLVSVVTLLR